MYATQSNCPVGTIERIRFTSIGFEEKSIEEYEEEFEEDVDDDESTQKIPRKLMATHIKVDTVEGECFTKITNYHPLLLRVFSAYSFGIQIQPYSLDCLNGCTDFTNFTLIRE